MTFTEYSKPPTAVLAEQIEDEPRSVITPNGPVTAQPGEWEVRYKDGNVRRMTDEDFQEEFGEASESDEDKDEEAPDTGLDEARNVDTQATVDRDSGTPDESENESDDAQSEDDSKSPGSGEGVTGSATHSPPRPTRRR
jgi:hypothetical protein